MALVCCWLWDHLRLDALDCAAANTHFGGDFQDALIAERQRSPDCRRSACQSIRWRARLLSLKLGATPLWKSPAYTVAFRRAEESRLAPIIEASGAKVSDE
jgi:hypothetical protein